MSQLSNTNIKIGNVKDVLGESTYALNELVNSGYVNKYGLWRFHFDASTTTLRLAELKDAPNKLGHFRNYYHSQLRSGFYVDYDQPYLPITGTLININSEVIIEPDGGESNSKENLFVSMENYTIEITEDWIDVTGETDTSTGGPTIIGAHTYTTDSSGTLTGGTGTTNALYGLAKITCLNNTVEAKRTGYILLKSPENTEGNAVPYRLRIVQGTNGFGVNPQSRTFTWNDTGTKNSVIYSPTGTYLNISNSGGGAIPSWLTMTTTPSLPGQDASNNIDSTTAYFSVEEQAQYAEERTATLEVGYYETHPFGLTPVDFKNITITQERNPDEPL